MLRILLDTNIYGKIIDDGEVGLKLAESMINDNQLIIPNFSLIRNELRKAPKILPVYDYLVKGRVIQENKEIKDLSFEYYDEYKINSGVQGKNSIINDFKIVACASLMGFDILVSEDQRTLLNPISIKAYRIVNLRNNLRTPSFLRYNELKRKY